MEGAGERRRVCPHCLTKCLQFGSWRSCLRDEVSIIVLIKSELPFASPLCLGNLINYCEISYSLFVMARVRYPFDNQRTETNKQTSGEAIIEIIQK